MRFRPYRPPEPSAFTLWEDIRTPNAEEERLAREVMRDPSQPIMAMNVDLLRFNYRAAPERHRTKYPDNAFWLWKGYERFLTPLVRWSERYLLVNAYNCAVLSDLAYQDEKPIQRWLGAFNKTPDRYEAPLTPTPQPQQPFAVTAEKRRAFHPGEDAFAFFESEETHTQGFGMAHDECVVLAFRGTEVDETTDIMTDLKAASTPFSGPGGTASAGKVHYGFYSAFRSIEAGVAEFLTKTKAADKPVICCGHSLGGALATLAAAYARERFSERVGLYTYGSPRVGTKAFVRYYSDVKPIAAFRHVMHDDPVVHLPSRSMSLVQGACVLHAAPSGDTSMGAAPLEDDAGPVPAPGAGSQAPSVQVQPADATSVGQRCIDLHALEAAGVEVVPHGDPSVPDLLRPDLLVMPPHPAQPDATAVPLPRREAPRSLDGLRAAETAAVAYTLDPYSHIGTYLYMRHVPSGAAVLSERDTLVTVRLEDLPTVPEGETIFEAAHDATEVLHGSWLWSRVADALGGHALDHMIAAYLKVLTQALAEYGAVSACLHDPAIALPDPLQAGDLAFALQREADQLAPYADGHPLLGRAFADHEALVTRLHSGEAARLELWGNGASEVDEQEALQEMSFLLANVDLLCP